MLAQQSALARTVRNCRTLDGVVKDDADEEEWNLVGSFQDASTAGGEQMEL